MEQKPKANHRAGVSAEPAKSRGALPALHTQTCVGPPCLSPLPHLLPAACHPPCPPPSPQSLAKSPVTPLSPRPPRGRAAARGPALVPPASPGTHRSRRSWTSPPAPSQPPLRRLMAAAGHGEPRRPSSSGERCRNGGGCWGEAGMMGDVVPLRAAPLRHTEPAERL